MPISSRRVSGSGPRPARIAFVGEGPGRDEDESGRAFTGPSGKVLWAMAADYADIDRRDVYGTNLSKFRLTDDRGKDRPPTALEAAEWTPALRAELRDVDPTLIVTLGRWSTGAVIGRALDMAVCNGMAYGGERRVCIPVTHPAAGLHQPQMLSATAEGLKAVGAWLKGGAAAVTWPVDRWPVTAYYPSHNDDDTFHFEPRVAIDTEGYVDDPWSLQWSMYGGAANLIRADQRGLLAAFSKALAYQRPTIILHHALHDLAVLKAMGIDLLAMGLTIRDTMIEAFLTQTNPQGLKPLAERLAGMAMRTYEDVVGPVAERFAKDYLLHAIEEPPGAWAIGEGRKHSVLKRIDGLLYPRPTRGEAKTIREKWQDESFAAVRSAVEAHAGPMPSPRMDDIDPKEFIPYACRDADATVRVADDLSASIDRLSLRVVHKVDHDALPLVARMQEVGMLVDTARVEELRAYVADELVAVTDLIRTLTGDPAFNPASGDEVAAYCIKRGLPMERMTKGGSRIQVNEDQLMLVRFADDAIEHILYFRELDKLRGTYIEPLPKFLKGDGRYRRLHPSYRTTAAITGRLACGGDSPNLMAFPSRTELGRRIRSCFVAGEGRVLGSADLSQIELRVGAGMSQDETMMDVYARDGDIHASTAAGVFEVAEADLDPMTQRYPAKTMNFLILFGGREHRLYGEMLRAGVKGFDLARCADMIERWFALYPGVERYIAHLMEDGGRDGMVRTEAGRIRHTPALRFAESMGYPFNRLREEAMRQASNFPIQGTAQEIMKRAMPRMTRIDHMEPLLQVHDEMIVEVQEGHEEGVGAQMVAAMTAESPWRGVPLKASWKTAPDWGKLK
jgi:uracil-DNA glycosylase family 4